MVLTPGIGPQVSVLISIYYGNPFWGEPPIFDPHPHDRFASKKFQVHSQRRLKPFRTSGKKQSWALLNLVTTSHAERLHPKPASSRVSF